MSVGDRVKKIIQRKGLSQEELAQKIGLDKSGMSKLLNNKRKVEESLLLKLSVVLGVSSDELLGREPNPYEQNKTNYIIDGLVKKYNLDLSIEGEREKLEQFIKLYADLRNS